MKTREIVTMGILSAILLAVTGFPWIPSEY